MFVSACSLQKQRQKDFMLFFVVRFHAITSHLINTGNSRSERVKNRVKDQSWCFKNQYQHFYPALQEMFCSNTCLNHSKMTENVCHVCDIVITENQLI